MRTYLTPLLVVLAMCVSDVRADTNIVSENFDSYTQSTFEATWRPDTGTGYNPTGGPNGLLVPNTGIGIIAPYDDPPGIQGQGIAINPGINEWDNDNDASNVPFELVPSATQSIRVSGDIFDNAEGNHRTTIGLRNDTVQREFGVFGYNFLELGLYNASDVTDPTDPTDPLSLGGCALAVTRRRVA